MTEVEAAEGSRGRGKPSIYDVAEAAGVSHMTVSRVLNGHPNIRPSTREKVLRTIEELNYTRNSIARALATRRAMRIGVLVEAPNQYGPNSTLRALERAARGHGYTVSAYSVMQGDDVSAGDAIADLVSQGVDALCVVAPRHSSLEVIPRRAAGLPTLIITPESPEGLLTAAVDQAAGAAMAVEHLIGLGHGDILHVAGPLDWLDARDRLETWRSVMETAGLAVRAPIIGDWTSDLGYRIGRTDAVFDEVTAVFVANDQMALGLVHGLTERGLRVPQDISIVGFDDLPDAAHFLPPLTTVRQDFAALGTMSMDLLIAATTGEAPLRHGSIQPELIVRESTAPPRH